MKTAMQEFIEWVEHWKNEPLSEFQQSKIKELLEKEKEQIIEAFIMGEDGVPAEQYYNQTYNQDSELPKEDKTFKRKSQWTEVDNMTKRLK